MKLNNQIIQIKGTGISGSFRLNKSPVKPKSEKLPKADGKKSEKVGSLASNSQDIKSDVPHKT